MKIKFWQFEYDFDKDDAKIVIPIALPLIALSVTELNKELLLAIATIYYLIYFFSKNIADKIKGAFLKIWFRCPKCKSRKILLQGYDTYKSDEHHAFYLCTKCKTTSILTEGGLTHE